MPEPRRVRNDGGVASAVQRPPRARLPRRLVQRPKTTEARVMESIIITTIGVTILLRIQPLGDALQLGGRGDDAPGRSAWPARRRPNAVMQNGMEKATGKHWRNGAGEIMAGPSRRTCSNVDTPTTNREAKTIQTR